MPRQKCIGPAEYVVVQGNGHVDATASGLDRRCMLDDGGGSAEGVFDRISFDHTIKIRRMGPAPEHRLLGGRGGDPPRLAAAEKVVASHARAVVVTDQNEVHSDRAASAVDCVAAE